MNNEVIWPIAVVIVLMAVGAAVYIVQRQRSRRLRSHFGPEYDHALETAGKRTKAEAELEARTKRVEKLDIRALTTAERDRYAGLWRSAQERFVDSPPMAVAEADHLVAEVMRVRGYPMTDFEQAAADVSVVHPHLVTNYRAAHAIALSSAGQKASTEELRQAMVHYRALFEELLGVPAREPELVAP